ncbi:SNW domain-containing protein 1-like [Saccostrea echinata]|uniref:SNW domain-containing protein 1-like n=1 Tax=Saccostrea echinata TaxID=191078 RepID=UPI002A84060F|nr:SNW domain-containing protein 1-like [Saccostrea echinata]
MAMKLSDILPAPSQHVFDREDDERQQRAQTQLMPVMSRRTAPPYGHRKGWIPRTQEDFGDGGAFPEVPVAQFPLGMGQKKSTSNALAVQLDSSGKIKYDAIARYGHGKDKVVHSKFQDLVPKQIDEDDPDMQLPDEEAVMDTTEKTRQALEKLVSTKISAALPVRAAEKQAPAQYIRYTPSQEGVAFNSGAKQRIIRMVEAQKDPMEPPKFKVNKKIPRGPPSPPAPVMHSPNRKVTVKEQQEWKIPPCISNWKNAKGYTIPLDKRLAADGRGLQGVHINENFAKLAEALYIADRKAREAVEMRAQIDRKIAQREKEKKEATLRQLAQKARDERAGIKQHDDEEVAERDEIRRERQKERQRDRNLARAAPDRRSRIQRERERDISEKIALNIPDSRAGGSGDVQFDQRLFNQSKGMDSGYGDEEAYNVYDQPWRKDHSQIANSIYRPSKNVDKEMYGDDLDTLMKSNRFVPDRGFAGTDRNARREGPVQFEQDEEDPFGLGQFLEQAKRGDKRNADDSRSSRDYEGSKSKKRRE